MDLSLPPTLCWTGEVSETPNSSVPLSFFGGSSSELGVASRSSRLKVPVTHGHGTSHFGHTKKNRKGGFVEIHGICGHFLFFLDGCWGKKSFFFLASSGVEWAKFWDPLALHACRDGFHDNGSSCFCGASKAEQLPHQWEWTLGLDIWLRCQFLFFCYSIFYAHAHTCTPNKSQRFEDSLQDLTCET